MDIELEKKIKDRLAELPKDILDAVQSSDLDKKVQEIGTRHQLHLDQIGDLADETMLVMLGFTETEDFVNTVARRLKIIPDKAASISSEISNAIFMPIRTSLQDFAEARSAEVISKIIPDAPIKAASPPPPVPPASSKPAAAPAQTAPMAPPPMPITPKIPKIEPADLMLTQKTVSTPPKTDAPKPNSYKADPYREPLG